jgi:hypothetical protein
MKSSEKNSLTITKLLKLAFSLRQLSESTTLSQNFLRNEIKFGNLRAKKFGSRVLVLSTDWEEYAKSREEWQPTDQSENKTGA